MEYKILNNITGERDMTSDEITAYNNSKPKASDKLKDIKEIRLQKLQETDWWVLRGDITDEQKLYRKNLRDIPSNYDSSKYNELLAREKDKDKDNFGQLTHAIWSKP
mgnify:CR=1 FL=1|tara:strand:+ start:699 stop:1019 length:321 start_codon:yes stop_codon:yes gene_type:complete